MNQRERQLSIGVGILAALFAAYFGIRFLLVKPLNEIDRQTLLLRDKLQQINEERRAYVSSESYLKGMAQRTFGGDADTATAQAGKMVTDQILRLDLKESEFTRMPVGPRKLRGAQEIGWSIQGEGPLAKMIDLLFVLEQTPQIHRLESMVTSVGDRPGRVKMRFRYLTLVIDAGPQVTPLELTPKWTLQSPERRYYDAIVQRDLLRPYVPRQPSGLEASATQAGPTPNAPPEMLKVVSLSEWQGVPEVHLCDLTSMRITRYQPGDTVGEGRIVQIDYRTLPMPGKPGLLSYSRVILKIGTAYWAVEHGQTLADKYLLLPEQYPPDLPKP